MTAPAATVIEFTLPFFPPDLDRNHGTDNRNARAKATKVYKRDCWLLASNVRQLLAKGTLPLQEPVRCELTFVVRNTRRDPDNLVSSSKALIDSLKAAGLIRDDNSRVFELLPPVVVAGMQQEIRVSLRGAA